MKVVEILDGDGVEPPPKSAVPRMEPVAGSTRHPAETSESEAKANSEANPAETEERDIGRRPDRVVARVTDDRTRPPRPAVSVNEPATIVIRRPAPGFGGDPCPAIVRLINPAAFPVGSP